MNGKSKSIALYPHFCSYKIPLLKFFETHTAPCQQLSAFGLPPPGLPSSVICERPLMQCDQDMSRFLSSANKKRKSKMIFWVKGIFSFLITLHSSKLEKTTIQYIQTYPIGLLQDRHQVQWFIDNDVGPTLYVDVGSMYPALGLSLWE